MLFQSVFCAVLATLPLAESLVSGYKVSLRLNVNPIGRSPRYETNTVQLDKLTRLNGIRASQITVANSTTDVDVNAVQCWVYADLRGMDPIGAVITHRKTTALSKKQPVQVRALLCYVARGKKGQHYQSTMITSASSAKTTVNTASKATTNLASPGRGSSAKSSTIRTSTIKTSLTKTSSMHNVPASNSNGSKGKHSHRTTTTVVQKGKHSRTSSIASLEKGKHSHSSSSTHKKGVHSKMTSTASDIPAKHHHTTKTASGGKGKQRQTTVGLYSGSNGKHHSTEQGKHPRTKSDKHKITKPGKQPKTRSGKLHPTSTLHNTSIATFTVRTATGSIHSPSTTKAAEKTSIRSTMSHTVATSTHKMTTISTRTPTLRKS